MAMRVPLLGPFLQGRACEIGIDRSVCYKKASARLETEGRKAWAASPTGGPAKTKLDLSLSLSRPTSLFFNTDKGKAGRTSLSLSLSFSCDEAGDSEVTWR